MKKIFTLLLGLMGVSGVMMGQTVEFRDNGTVIGNGETVTYYAAEDEWGTVSATTNTSDFSHDLRLYNLTDNDINGKATMTVVSNTLGTDTRQWCMGGECVSTSESSYVKDFTIPAGESIQVQYDIEPLQQGEMVSDLSVRVGLSTVASITIRLVYGASTGISDVDAGSSSIEVARYGADGSRLVQARRGLNIVKYSDGRIVKVIEH